MGLADFITKQFIDVISWTEEGDDVLAWRFPTADLEIQQGAALIVRDTQTAVFVDEGSRVKYIAVCSTDGEQPMPDMDVDEICMIGAGEILRPLGQLSTFVVSAIALVVILFFPSGFMGRLLQAGGRE